MKRLAQSHSYAAEAEFGNEADSLISTAWLH